MIITKCAKRLMATVMTTALVLTGLVVAPKEVSAAEGDPTVEVLGATLRLDGNKENCQSMRVGIKVTNASKAKACGIKLSIGTVENKKEAVVSTETGKTNIYDYDKVNDVVIYTAVITDIPKDKFSEKVNIQGTTKAINSETETLSTGVDKSVDSVVTGLKAKDANIDMTEDGTLAKIVNSLDTTSANNVKEIGSVNNFSSWKFPVGKDTNLGNDVYGNAQVEYDSTEQALKVTTDSSSIERSAGKGLVYQVDGSGAGDYIYEMKFKAATSEKVMLKGYFDRVSDGGIGGKEVTGTGDWQTIDVKTTLGQYGACTFATKNAGGVYYVESFKIYQLLTNADIPDFSLFDGNVELSADTLVMSGATNVQYHDGKVTLTLNKMNSGTGLGFKLKKDGSKVDLSEYSKVVINTTSNNNMPDKTYIPICVNLISTPKNGQSLYYPNMEKGENMNIVYYINELKKIKENNQVVGTLSDATAIFIKYNAWVPENETFNGPETITFTINSIKLVK